ncbi:dihydrodipicolinate synthase family protein [Enterobacteriaceae bacterium RIT697]|nr:dihydrodipicolinate synthase family protein [Enterobacteriaceae bacterium RIT697]
MNQALFAGVNAAALTAFKPDLSIDYEKSAAHCRWLLDNGCHGLAILGTTAETNSLSLDEREQLLEHVVASGIPAEKILPGTAACDIPSAVRLTQHAEKMGCKGVLLLPPFYYKSPSLDGLVKYYSEIITRIGGTIGIYLYHFPQQSAVAITPELIAILLDKHPGRVKGIKDSSGDANNTKTYIDRFAARGFEVYTGSDADFLTMLQTGASGCITAMTNLTAGLARQVFDHIHDDVGKKAQLELAALRRALAVADTIPAVKAVKSALADDPQWDIVRPPLCSLPTAVRQQLIASFQPLIAG